jgi:hypothetical protein
MSSLYDRLGYDFDSPSSNSIVEFSDKTLAHMNSVPALLSDWQMEDLVSSNVGGYFTNPVASVISYIRNASNAS